LSSFLWLEAIMSDVSGNGHYVQCPLCEGKGQMQESDLLARLNNKELLQTCREQLAAQRESRQAAAPAAVGAKSEFEKEVRHGPVTRILWRRSPKE
jgi:hypothetical protein